MGMRKAPQNYILLLLFTLAESVMVGFYSAAYTQDRHGFDGLGGGGPHAVRLPNDLRLHGVWAVPLLRSPGFAGFGAAADDGQCAGSCRHRGLHHAAPDVRGLRCALEG